jgi:uncharacterized membrane protein
MAIEDRRRAWFSFGRVFSRGFATFGQAMAPALLITLIFIVAPQAALLWTVGGFSTSADFERLANSGMMIGGAVGGILIWIFGVAAQTGLVHLALSAQQRLATSFAESMLTGLRLFLPILGLSILVSLGTALGLILLIVPGVILMIMWCVAIPARIHDGPGVTAAMGESSSLTKGVRWQVFAMLLLTGIGLYAVGLLGGLPAIWMPPETAKFAIVVLQPLATGVSALVTAFGTASLFHELKWGDRDPGEEATAELFA